MPRPLVYILALLRHRLRDDGTCGGLLSSSWVGSELRLDPCQVSLSLLPQLPRHARVESEGSGTGDGGAEIHTAVFGKPTTEVAALARDGEEGTE